jgi:hypothetical protein
VRSVATRWGIPLGPRGGGTVALPADVAHQLDRPAMARKTTVEALALAVLRVVARDRPGSTLSWTIGGPMTIEPLSPAVREYSITRGLGIGPALHQEHAGTPQLTVG